MPWTGGYHLRSEQAVRQVRQRLLGSDAIYRVRRSSGPLVEVEVVAAPALVPGTRLRFTAASVRAMARPVVRRRSDAVAAHLSEILLRAALIALRPPAA
jgi:hypothetical protein